MASRFWYAGFLLRYQNELDGALKEFKEAAKLDPTSLDIQMETALTCLYLRRFSEAKTIIDNLLKQFHLMKAVVRRKIYDLYLQVFVRKAEYLINQRDKVGAFEELEHLQQAYQNCPSGLIDDIMKKRLENAGGSIRICTGIMQDENGRKRADQLLEWFENDIMPKGSKEIYLEQEKKLEGKVVRLVSGRNFGFILATNGQEFFFRRFNMAMTSQWRNLSEGSNVSFWDGGFKDGPNPTAVNIIIDSTDV